MFKLKNNMRFKENVSKYVLKLSSYGLIGILVTTIAILGYYYFLEVLHFPLYPTYISIYLLGVFLSYILNIYFTFDSSFNLKSLSKFYLVYIFGFSVGLFLLFLLDFLFSTSDFINILLIIPPRVLLTFLLTDYLVFED